MTDRLLQPLSSTQILKALDGKVKIITSDQLHTYKTIDELLEPYNRVVILYIWKTNPMYGHFTALSKRGNTIDYFDSFGNLMDSVNKQLPDNFASIHHLDYPYLTKLLYESPYNIEFNEKQMQNKKTSVCGRYAITKLALNDLPMEQFQKLFGNDTLENDRRIIELTTEI